MSSTADSLIGRTLDGRYRVLRRVADGGMATVYLALDERLDREVALKVMRHSLVHDESFVSRFRREARSAASLSHPNVVAVFDQGTDGDHIFLAMEFVPGKTLRDVLKDEGPLSPRAALDVLEPVLLALAEAHGKGLIHRDVKPENVIISDTGAVKVADFGLARAVTSQTVTTSTGMLLGTVAYLSPEQVERGVADARSDVYAAGLVLFEMLTGGKAFTGETPIHVAYQHVHGGVPAPSSRVEGIPAALDELVDEATSRDPDDRPADAAELLGLLRRVRSGLSPAALDARPAGVAAEAAASMPTATAPLTHHGAASAGAAGAGVAAAAGASGATGGASGGRDGGAGRGSALATREGPSDEPRGTGDERTTALTLGPPLEGVVVDEDRRSRRWWPAIAASALVAALTAWFFLLGPGAVVRVPSVEARPQAQAVQALEAASLDARVVEGFSESVPKGQVISADPAPGAEVRKGTDVRLVVSKGPERYLVPKVVGMSQAEAERQITGANLSVGKVTQAFSDKVPEGQVVAAKPGPGASLKRGTAVALTISKGRQPVSVPDFTGKAAKPATEKLTDLGLEVDATKQANSDTVPKGSVISQDPRGGTLYRGDTVTLVVSKGPVLVTVPNVVGQQVQQARATLEAAGFKVDVRRALGGYFGTVRLQDPAAGTKAPKGSVVTLTIV
ncbi:Stk1 family PASTA domain-containing Ser/Thr kinase [Oryzobacter sp. R7]|uniref:Stk1 family PASTA domain-containing Ser/Thr kinase n=1 Tax=Oryzobacter faecalis TaxID=3388656 RepID=UPI00398C9D51